VNVDVPLHNLPPALHGFSIVQISDIHVGTTIRKKYVEKIVKAVNALKPDLIAVTGDVVDGSVRDLRVHTAPLAGCARCMEHSSLPVITNIIRAQARGRRNLRALDCACC
jgi:predicted MPP superfamily phosphohydrolase